MNYGVLGTGMVGRTIANKLVADGHSVALGSRDAGKDGQVSLEDAARHGEVVFVCTPGHVAVDTVRALAAHLDGKVVVDVSNPLDFSKGMPPTLFTTSAESLGERVQAAIPRARVVKTLNTVNAEVMVKPATLAGGDHTMFLCGDDAAAKGQVSDLLRSWGWRDLIDLGPISNARGTEEYLMLWVRLWGALGTAGFSVKVVR